MTAALRRAAAAVLLTQAVVAAAAERAGTVTILSRTVHTQGVSDGSQFSSNDRDQLVERVVAVRPDGLELDYDLPADVPSKARAQVWQLPARILRHAGGPARLLNRAALEARRDAWLARAKLPRSACGRWTFTWTAIRIECDPQSALDRIAAFDLAPPELRAGAAISDRDAGAPGVLQAAANGTFTARMPIDPVRVRRERAEAAVATAEILKQRLTLDEALRRQADLPVAGTVTVTFHPDAAGAVRRKVRLVEIVTGTGAAAEKAGSTETVERGPPSGL